MRNHPFSSIGIVGVHNSPQWMGADVDVATDALGVEVALGAIADAGIPLSQVDGLVSNDHSDLAYQLGIAPAWRARIEEGIPSVTTAASAVAAGLATCVLVTSSPATGDAPGGATAAWTRPDTEFDSFYGVYTAAQYAMIAARHMHQFGTTPEALAAVAATIRNNGQRHPLAATFGRGPYTIDDVLASRMIADPFHLLDCAIVSVGAAALLVARRDIAEGARPDPVFILGVGSENHGAWFHRRPIGFDEPDDARPDLVDGWLGRHSAECAWRMSGLGPEDIDVCELYDPFSFEVIRQLEAYGFCPRGEGGAFVLDGNIALTGRYPCNTDGGLLSFSHPGSTVQLLQRVIRGVQQLRGECGPLQVSNAEVALCSNTSSGGLFGGVMILGNESP